MKKSRIRLICFVVILIIIAMLSFYKTTSNAADMNDIYKGNSLSNTTLKNGTAGEAVGKVLGLVQAVGYVSAVIVLTMIGIKFLWSSPEGKADLKKQLIPYFIGMVILISGGTIAGIIANVAFNNQ